MPSRFLNNITVNDSYTLPNADGTADQIIKTNGAGELSFIDQGDIIAGEADKAKSVILRVKNSTGSPMSKGQVVCEAVSATPPSGNLIEVALADNNGTNTMPALGILNDGLDPAGGAKDEGDAIMFGKVSGINTSAFSVGDEVFVDDTPGGLTTTKPTGVKYIQKVGVVIRDDATNGTIEVFGAGRVNDVPTPLYIDHANQRLGIGTTSPNEKLTVAGQIQVTDSGAQARLSLNNTGTGDSQINFQLNNTSAFSLGVDNSDGNKFKITGGSGAIGSNDRFVIDSSGNVVIGAKIDVGIGLSAGALALDVKQKAYVRAGLVISPNPGGVQVDDSSLVVGAGNNDIVSGSDHCLTVGSGNQIISDSDRSVSFGLNNETKQSDNSINVGNNNVLRYSNNSHIIGQNNQIGDDYTGGAAGFNNSIVFGSDNLLLTDDGSTNPPNGGLSFVIGHDNDLRHTEQNSFSIGYSISNLGGSATAHRNDFNIGGDLIAVNQTMTLGYRNDPTSYPTIDRNNGLGETKFAVSVGSSTTTNANALLITEGGITGGGGGTVPQIPRVIFPTIVNFNFANDTAAAAGGIPVGGLYHNSGVLRIRIT